MARPDDRWRFLIDRGGTFTDIVAIAPDGLLRTAKLLSDNPDHYEDAAVEGMRRMLGVAEPAPFPRERIHSVRIGTTIATNALLERTGAPTALVVTKGFADALLIGRQHRPRLFDLAVRRAKPLYGQVIEAEERVDAAGRVVTPLAVEPLRRALQDAFETGFAALAIAFVHGFRQPDHERMAAEIARSIGFRDIAMSHEVAPLERFVPRGQTTIAEAWLSPVVRRYAERLEALLGGTPLWFMQSSGGLVSAERLRGKDALLSGPAGGVTGVVETARMAGADHIIGFDMGGTSTDVCHYAGAYERRPVTEIEGLNLLAPTLDVHTVAAGGGSICRFDGQRFLVGPQSAGARPGPASYGNGGPLAITDCNLRLGKLQADYFPRVFGPDQASPLDREAVGRRLSELAGEIERATGSAMSPEAAAEGFIRVAVEHMARAIRKITIERGHDVSRYSLAIFGGAGGQHGCLVADALGIEKVISHPMAGVLSALGMGLSRPAEIRERAVLLPLSEDNRDRIEAALAALEAEARAALEDQQIAGDRIVMRRSLMLRAGDAEATLSVPYGDMAAVRAAFREEHRKAFGFAGDDGALFVEAAGVEAVADETAAVAIHATDGRHRPLDTKPVYMDGAWRDADIFERDGLAIDRAVDGPAIILDGTGTTVIEPGWRAVKSSRGDLVISRFERKARARSDEGAPDPVLLEVFNNLFMSVAEQMGAVLERTAHSVNMKERLDFSCALFDREGGLVANAPHMPVHLGSMGESVRAVIARMAGALRPGDAVMLNDPYEGGTHLPDITVVTPVWFAEEATPHFFVASRGHHADIGGIAPGSMPSGSRHIDEEGIRIAPMLLRRDGRLLEAEALSLLRSGRWPARDPARNIADLKAQLAANEAGIREIRRLADEHGLLLIDRYMRHVTDNAAEAVRRVIDRLEDGAAVYPMDCGAVIKVAIRVDRHARRAAIDFSGASGRQDGNFNAPRSISRAAALYVFRCLVGEDIPLNDGCFAPLDLIVPEGSLLDPKPPAAVVAGNVETSQALTNALFLALGAMAASQGTMNNLTFGNADHQYYETIGGGTGAGPDFAGEHAIQSHMTNSRLTDVELLEARHPVRLEAFHIRAGSGGAGRHRGGDGAVRQLLFLEDMDVNILAGHRLIPPPGLKGGAPGQPGLTQVLRADGRRETLKPSDSTRLKAGDRLIIKTPGGGGFGG